MQRRALLGGGLAAAAGGILATVDGTAALAAVMNHGLRDAISEPSDWDQLAADFARRHVLAPSPEFGAELAAQITIAQDYVNRGDRDATRGAAMMSMIYGLWLGDTGRIPSAHGLYETAAHLAERAGDSATQALVRARAASRGPYEGWTAKRTTTEITRALSLSNTGASALEAHAATVHLAGLTGDIKRGRIALAAMELAAESMPDADGPSAMQRVVSFRNYLECRAGSYLDARRANGEAVRELADVPLWLADADLYMGRAYIVNGDPHLGLCVALDAVKRLGFGTRILGIGVRDVLSVVPKGYRDDALDQLRLYASQGPTPWETLS